MERSAERCEDLMRDFVKINGGGEVVPYGDKKLVRLSSGLCNLRSPLTTPH